MNPKESEERDLTRDRNWDIPSLLTQSLCLSFSLPLGLSLSLPLSLPLSPAISAYACVSTHFGLWTRFLSFLFVVPIWLPQLLGQYESPSLAH